MSVSVPVRWGSSPAPFHHLPASEQAALAEEMYIKLTDLYCEEACGTPEERLTPLRARVAELKKGFGYAD